MIRSISYAERCSEPFTYPPKALKPSPVYVNVPVSSDGNLTSICEARELDVHAFDTFKAGDFSTAMVVQSGATDYLKPVGPIGSSNFVDESAIIKDLSSLPKPQNDEISNNN